MTWNTIFNKLKSPVVIFQIVTILGGALVLFRPDLESGWKIVAGVLVALYNVFAGLNNPDNKEGF